MTVGLSKVANTGSSPDVSDLSSIVPTTGKTIKMTLNQAASGHLMERLTDMYNYPILATVREVVSNATDATVVAMLRGLKMIPVEIEMPSSFSPEFVVRDHGIGMSPDTIENIFATYGGSTKSDSFDQIGAFGLGAKAPLSYCKDFSFETTNDGITSKVLVSRLASGPETKILSIERTGAPSGTTMRIPVSLKNEDINAFKSALNSYRYLSFDVPLLIDGELFSGNSDYVELNSLVIEPVSGTTGRVWVNKESFSSLAESAFNDKHNRQWNFSYLLSGYLYKSPSSMNSSLMRHGCYGDEINDGKYSDVIVELKPGVVNFTSSRDEIMKDERISDLDKRVLESLLGINEYMANNLVSDKVLSEFSDFLYSDALSVINPKVVDGKVLMISSGYVENEFDVSDFTKANGFNPIEDSLKFNARNTFAVCEFNENNGTRKLLKIEHDDSFDAKYEYIPYSLKITLMVDKVVGNFINRSSVDNGASGHTLSLVQTGNTINSIYSSNRHVFVVTGMDDEKKVKRLLRARKSLAETNGRFILVIVDRDVSDGEKEAFLSRLNDEIKDNISWIDDDHIVKLNKMARKKVVSTGIKVDLMEFKPEGYVEESEVIKGIVPNYLQNLSSVDVSGYYDNNALFIVSLSGYCSKEELANVCNGYRHEKGFEALKGRPVYAINKPLKASALDLLKSDEEVVLLGNNYHASSEVVEKFKNIKKFYRMIVEDVIDECSELELIASYFFSKVNSHQLDAIKEIMVKASNHAVKKVGTRNESTFLVAKMLTDLLAVDMKKVPVYSSHPSAIMEKIDKHDWFGYADLMAKINKHIPSYYANSSVLGDVFRLFSNDGKLPENMVTELANYIENYLVRIGFSA